MQICLNDLDKLHHTTRYAVEVVSGLRPACKREWQACDVVRKTGKTGAGEVFAKYGASGFLGR